MIRGTEKEMFAESLDSIYIIIMNIYSIILDLTYNLYLASEKIVKKIVPLGLTLTIVGCLICVALYLLYPFLCLLYYLFNIDVKLDEEQKAILIVGSCEAVVCGFLLLIVI